ncbi:MAG TPA: VWA domain-containing protein [Gemmataceae bacterium]|nr:VWA domain-containing protein [Gemmataceae bacterium]
MPALFAMLGLWGTVAVGAAAVSVPVIIHLLNRRRFRVVVWAAMRFLLNAQKQNTRRMRLEQIILLAVRASVILLVVLAMAAITPWAEAFWNMLWPDAGSSLRQSSARRHKIIVLDGSLSMALRTDGGKTCFERGRELALQLVRESSPGDGLSVALMKDVPTWIVGEPSLESGKVLREIEGLRQAHGNANVAATLNMVAAKLTESGKRFDAREVYFITDMQRSTWLGGPLQEGGKQDGKDAREKAALQEIQQRASTTFVDVGRDNVTNLTVTDVTLDDSLLITGNNVLVKATVQSFGPDIRKDVRVELLAGRAREKADDPPFALRSVAKEMLDEVKPGSPVRVPPFVHKFTTPGTYVLQVRVQEDELPVDDSRTVVVTVREKVPVLVVNGKPSANRFERATEYLRVALNPPALPGRPASEIRNPIQPRVVSVSQFADVNDSKLADYDCVYLCDVSKLTVGDVRRLEAHLRRGGGIVVSLGDRIGEHLEGYNRLLSKKGAELLPARLESVRQAEPGTYYSMAAKDDDFTKPPLKAFADADQRFALTIPPFARYVETTPAGNAREILSFMPEAATPDKEALTKKMPRNEPALLEWNPPLPAEDRARLKEERENPGQAVPATPSRYRGKVILFTSTLNLDWGNWPKSPSFLPMMQELVRVAVSGKLRERSQTVGGLLEEFLQAGAVDLDGKLYLPGKDEPVKTRIRGVNELTIFRWAETDLAGVYRLTVGSDPHDYLFAVNVPTAGGDGRPSESDLTRVTKEQLRSAFPAWDFQTVTNLRDVRRVDVPGTEGEVATRGDIGPTIARWLLVVVLLLLLVEVVLAWVFGHHTVVAGAAAPPRVGLLWPALLGGIALVVFVLIAFTLIHAYQTGDFLSFLGDGFRGWVEGLLEVPPPAAGEGTRWHLEFTPFLSSDPMTDLWLIGGIAVLALGLIVGVYFVEPKTANLPYKLVLGGFRIFLVLLTLVVLLPQLRLRFERQGWPDVVLLIDDSKSMGVTDHFREDAVQTKADSLGEHIRKQIQQRLPEQIKALQAQRDEKNKALAKDDPRGKAEIDALTARISVLDAQLSSVNSPNFKPSRLQLAQALLSRQDPDWIGALLSRRKMKVHIFHLDAQGRLVKIKDAKGGIGEITAADAGEQARAREAIADLRPTGNDSRLGTAVRQVLDYYRGASLTAVIMLTDGVTTRDETLSQVSEYAGQRGVPLFFVGIGDDHEVRDLKLHDLQVEETVYVHDRVVFEARLTGRGYKDLKVPVVLKIRQKDGSEKVLKRQEVNVNKRGTPVRVTFIDQPDTPGERLYIVEAEMPRLGPDEKPPNPADLRLQRTVFVQDAKTIKALYIEGSPRYEWRFVKSLLERESPGKKKQKSVEFKVLLTDADEGFPAQDDTALAAFPATRQELFAYDVIILGDVDPRSRKIGEGRLRDLADFVREKGGGLLMIAGTQFSPHAYKGTPLAEVLPIEPGVAPIEPEDRPDGYRPELTPVGRRHPIFRFSSDDADNMVIWGQLAPMYWWSEGYRIKPLAEVLAVHPKVKGDPKAVGGQQGHPLVAQQFVGAGRCMFFGFDETWRWRFRQDEARFSHFWIQTVRYLSRSRISRTTLRLDRQAPYRVGEPIKVTVQFPDNSLVPGLRPDKKGPDKIDVKVMVEHKPAPGEGGDGETEIQTLQLAKVEGSWATYEGILVRTREGKYKFSLTSPDVSRQQPSGEKPSAEAVVVPPPGELDRLRMNVEELKQAAEATDGQFYTLATADRVLDDLPPGVRVEYHTPRKPDPLWNHLVLFLLVLGLLTSEWVLRKRKHLL